MDRRTLHTRGRERGERPDPGGVDAGVHQGASDICWNGQFKGRIDLFFSLSHPLSNLLIKNSAEERDIGTRGAGNISPCLASTPRASGLLAVRLNLFNSRGCAGRSGKSPANRCGDESGAALPSCGSYIIVGVLLQSVQHSPNIRYKLDRSAHSVFVLSTIIW